MSVIDYGVYNASEYWRHNTLISGQPGLPSRATRAVVLSAMALVKLRLGSGRSLAPHIKCPSKYFDVKLKWTTLVHIHWWRNIWMISKLKQQLFSIDFNLIFLYWGMMLILDTFKLSLKRFLWIFHTFDVRQSKSLDWFPHLMLIFIRHKLLNEPLLP